MRFVLALGILASALCARSASAQDVASWAWEARLSTSIALNDTDWSISHPYYGGGAPVWETFRGTFTQRVWLQGGLELRKRHLGVRGRLGVMPQGFTQEAPAAEADLRLVLGGLGIAFYPMDRGGEGVETYFAVGAGGMKATGGLSNGGYYLSGATGVRIGVSERVAFDAGLQLMRLNYSQIQATPYLARDARTYPVSVFLGVRVGG